MLTSRFKRRGRAVSRGSSSCANRGLLIFTGVKREDSGPVLESGAGVGAAGVGIQQAPVANTTRGADEEIGAKPHPLGPKGVKRCHAGNSSGVVFRMRNATRNITISHKNSGTPCYPVVH